MLSTCQEGVKHLRDVRCERDSVSDKIYVSPLLSPTECCISLLLEKDSERGSAQEKVVTGRPWPESTTILTREGGYSRS